MTKTREEFEAEYNGGDIMPLLRHGRLSIECRCDWEFCDGWKMTHLDSLSEDIANYGNTPSQIAAAIAHRLDLLDGKKID